MLKLLAKLLRKCPGGEPASLAESDWFDDEVTPKERKAILKKYAGIYKEKLAELIGLLGKPAKTEKANAAEIGAWYPEAIRAACWEKDDKTVCLSLVQHDSETPVAVVLQCLTAEEIDELSE